MLFHWKVEIIMAAVMPYLLLFDHTGVISVSRDVVQCIWLTDVQYMYIHNTRTSERQSECEHERERADIGTGIWLLGGSSR